MSGRSKRGTGCYCHPDDRTRIIEEAGLEIHRDQTDTEVQRPGS